MFYQVKIDIFFNIKGACKAIDVVIKTGKTSANNNSFSISQEPTTQYFLKCKYCVVDSYEIMKDLLLVLVFHFFPNKNGHFFNFNDACKAIDVVQDVKL